jgi:hypothetical protein
MEDGDPGDWENGKTETYEISTKNWREVYGGRLIRRTSIHYDTLLPLYVVASALHGDLD